MPSIDESSALQLYLDLTAIEGISGDEKGVSDFLSKRLLAAGFDESMIHTDTANERTRIAGNTGNLIAKLPGKGSLASNAAVLLTAHMDTVPICVGSQPVVEGDYVVSANPESGLGADDRSGCAVLATVAETLASAEIDHPPIVFCWLIQEEIGLQGAKCIDPEGLGPIGLAYNFDGGSVDKLTLGATSGERIEIELTGIPAHAGVAPEQGASAIVMASSAIAKLHQDGWLGKVEKDGRFGTANVGVISGGDATNVITPLVQLRAEARSHDAEFRNLIVAKMKEAFQEAASNICNTEGKCGELKFESHLDYEAFRLPDDYPSVTLATTVLKELGREPYCIVADGGLDANWLFQHGISSLTMGCGQMNIHTKEERLLIPDYLAACKVALRLACAGD